jgi:hypothetical protein
MLVCEIRVYEIRVYEIVESRPYQRKTTSSRN